NPMMEDSMMKFLPRIASIVMVLGATATVLPAAQATQGKDKALETLQLGASEHVRILNEVAAKLPPKTQADLSPAMDAAAKGLQAARAAMATTGRETAATHQAAMATMRGMEEPETPEVGDDDQGENEMDMDDADEAGEPPENEHEHDAEH